ncbi:MAG: hypothetical protein KDJ82_16270 [Rhodobacteraceae bacterium]|nr:hypothetical protein [Paracoccaceae bacterium]
MSHFDLSAERLFRAMTITTQSARACLAGALVEPIEDGGAWIVATNGSAMLIQRDRKAVAPRPIVLRITAPEPPEPDPDDAFEIGGWHWCGSHIRIRDTPEPQAAPVLWGGHETPGTHVIVEEVTQADRYPDWRAAIAAKAKGGEAIRVGCTAFTTSLLLPLIEGRHQFRLHAARPGHAISVTWPDDPDALGVIMPCVTKPRGDEELAQLFTALGRDDLIETEAADA